MILPKYEQILRDQIARRTAQLDQRERRNADHYVRFSPEYQLELLDAMEADRFGIEISKWELEMILADPTEELYPQKTEND